MVELDGVGFPVPREVVVCYYCLFDKLLVAITLNVWNQMEFGKKSGSTFPGNSSRCSAHAIQAVQKICLQLVTTIIIALCYCTCVLVNQSNSAILYTHVFGYHNLSALWPDLVVLMHL